MELILKESQYNRIFQLITEADSRLKALDRIIRNSFQGILNPDDIVAGPEYYVNNNPNTTWGQYIAFSFRHTFSLMQNSDMKFIPGFAAIAIGELGFETTNPKQVELNNLMKMVQLCQQEPTLYTKYVQGKSYQEVYEHLGPILTKLDNEEQERINSAQYHNQFGHYEILSGIDYKTANQIGSLSCPDSNLCYTQSEDTWSDYTHDDLYKVYVLLRDDWKTVQCAHTKDLFTGEMPQSNDWSRCSAYDSYGLSMIFVFINDKNDLVYCNTRWNHEATYQQGKSTDHALSKEQISQLIGQPFQNVFHSWTREDILKDVGPIYQTSEYDIFEISNNKILSALSNDDFEYDSSYSMKYLVLNKNNSNKFYLSFSTYSHFECQVNNCTDSYRGHSSQFAEIVKQRCGFTDDIINFFESLHTNCGSVCNNRLNIEHLVLSGLFVATDNNNNIISNVPFKDSRCISSKDYNNVALLTYRHDNSVGLICPSISKDVIDPNENILIEDKRVFQDKYVIAIDNNKHTEFVIDITTGQRHLHNIDNLDCSVLFGASINGFCKIEFDTEDDDTAYQIYDLNNDKFVLNQYVTGARLKECNGVLAIIKYKDKSLGDCNYNIINCKTMKPIIPENCINIIHLETGYKQIFAVGIPNDAPSYCYTVLQDGTILKGNNGGMWDLNGDEWVNVGNEIVKKS